MAKFISQIIKDKELTNDQAAEKLGVSKSRISQILNSEQTPSFDSLFKYLELLDTHFDIVYKTPNNKNMIMTVYINE